MTRITALCTTIHAQALVTLEARAAAERRPGARQHRIYDVEAERLAALIAELRALPATTPAEAAAKVRIVAALFDANSNIHIADLGILGEPVAAWLERVADDLDAMR